MSKIEVIYAPIQSVPGREISEDFKEQVIRNYQSGIFTVVPAGNFGPIINSMSSMALLPNIISVAATDNDGSFVADFSSRGIPGNVIVKPTISAPGIDQITGSHSGITQIKENRNQKIKYLTKRQVYLQWGRIITTRELRTLQKSAYILSGTSMAAEKIAQLIALILQFLKENKINYDSNYVMRILKNIANPINHCLEHEVGYGFINIHILKRYFDKLCKSNDRTDEQRDIWPMNLERVKLTGKGVGMLRLDNTVSDHFDISKNISR